MRGLMQDVPLTIDLALRRAAQAGPGAEVVSVEPAGERRATWREVAARAARLSRVLDRLGVPAGAVVGTFAWNGQRHLELYLGVPCAGRVLHSVNLRLFSEDVVYVVRHAADAVLFVDASLTATLAPVRERLGVATFVVMEDGGEIDPAFAGDPRYEQLLEQAGAADLGELPALDERDAASICFTSGTTGRPKAVVYSHRSVVLHSFNSMGVDSHGISRRDTVLPLTPMFHVNCWGLPYTAALAGARLVLPGRDTSPAHTAALVERERVTVAAGVPTLWIRMLDELSGGRDLSSLRRILVGGAEISEPVVARYHAAGVDVFHGWGATELSPSGTASVLRAGHDDGRWGPAVPGVELRLAARDGGFAPWDGVAAGELEARGPWVASAYFAPEDDANATRFTPDGWFRTGDVARIHPDGAVEIVDREKDLVKSGGEWISSAELERAIVAHPQVREAVVIGVADPEWGERPAALIVAEPGAAPTAAELRAFLHGTVASWWIPAIFELLDELPKTGVGKYDKRALRAQHGARLAAGAPGGAA